MAYVSKSITIKFEIQYYKVPRRIQKSIRQTLKAMADDISTVPIEISNHTIELDGGVLTVQGTNKEHHITQIMKENISKWFREYCEKTPELLGLDRTICIDNRHNNSKQYYAYYPAGDIPESKSFCGHYVAERIILNMPREVMITHNLE
jgi:bisphosphoglycerate-dependent phosphoglycerate mutase